MACAAAALLCVPIAVGTDGVFTRASRTPRVPESLSYWWLVVLALSVTGVAMLVSSRRGFAGGIGTYREVRSRRVALVVTSVLTTLVVSGFLLWLVILSRAALSYTEGRPLRHRWVRRSRRVIVSEPHPLITVGINSQDDIRPVEAAALARRWKRAGDAELESVATFRQLLSDLICVGAPPELLERTRRAIREEAEHTTRCRRLSASFAIGCVSASGFSGRRAPVRRPRHVRRVANVRDEAGLEAVHLVRLVRIAVESTIDGCFGEGVAALDMALRAEHCTDPVREHVARTAVEEQGHADLAWAIVSWAADEGGQLVVDAVVRAARRLPAVVTSAAVPAGCRRDVLLRYGWDDAETRAWVTSRVRDEVTERMATLALALA
jgi:hypothetical protein